ncbi:unnamed protein product [Pseudo-nitzschia multistriata]|uniref:FAD dependent oxidoreductase domain-containing protein n=1 Tax=Pseudo-nitzschia multistriata TaxID=183589 RepID=A0A448ZGA4_9STRA|nr:unnamed protein product [Pseudo-nitzschia multistriata]
MVVIVGAGVAGVATAYYLSVSSGKTPITLLDAAGPAACSSGKAGAFITNRPPSFRRGIGKGNNVDDKRRFLFEKSFELHEELAKDLSLESFCRVHNYRTIQTKETNADDKNDISFDDPEDTLHSWLTSLGENEGAKPLSGAAALLDPAELTNAMLEKVLSQGNCCFRQANISGLELDSSGRFIKGIQLENSEDGSESKPIVIEEDEAVVIALGPWSCRIEDWLGIPMPIEGVLSTSLIYQDGIPASDSGTAFFFDEDSNGCHLEVFGRKDRSLYVSGCGESQVIGTRCLRSTERPSPNVDCPPDATRASAARASLEKAGYDHRYSTDISEGNPQPDTTQACLRPMTPDNVPIVGKLLDNAYIATGGGPWGITWGPLMGQSLASLINDDGDPPIRLGLLSHKRFDTLVYRTLLKSRSFPGVSATT